MATAGNHRDFDVRIWSDEGRYFAQVVDSPVGRSAREPLKAPFGSDPRERELYRLQLENAVLRGGSYRGSPISKEEKILRDFGSRMYAILLKESGSVASTYSACRATGSLRMKLTVEPPELATLPWEYLFEEKPNNSADDYLCLTSRSPIVRYLDFGLLQPSSPVVGRLNILGMIANPRGEWGALDVERERGRIDDAVASIADKSTINFQWVQGQTQEDLLDMMQREQWHVFHFIGHGGIDERQADDGSVQSEGFIVLADGLGGADKLAATDLALTLENSGAMQLAVLNCCESAYGAGTASPGAALVKSGVPTVVAMQYPISDDAAVSFASMFYKSLLNGNSVELALTAARKLMHSKSPVEWGIPVLFTRGASAALVGRPAAVPPSLPMPSPASTPIVVPTAAPAAPTDYERKKKEARAALRRLFAGSGAVVTATGG